MREHGHDPVVILLCAGDVAVAQPPVKCQFDDRPRGEGHSCPTRRTSAARSRVRRVSSPATESAPAPEEERQPEPVAETAGEDKDDGKPKRRGWWSVGL